MMEHAPLIVVIDDDAGVCTATARVLSASGFRVRTHTRARQFLETADTLSPDCILADIRMPETTGIELAEAMRSAGVDVPLVYMTATGDVSTVVDAMKQGAVDLLPKPFSSDALLDAIGRAMDIGRRKGQAHRSLAALWGLFARLTTREAEICGLVSTGIANKQVASLSGIKEKTVKVHRARVMRKLEAPSLAELVRMVMRLHEDRATLSLRIDGGELERPRAVEIVLESADRVRESARGNHAPSGA
jgi:FixJ family two-component response regulator